MFEGVIADFSVRHDEVINQTVPAVHIDEVTNITYTIHGLPLGVVHNASQGTIQGNPTQYGNFTITVLGTDLSRSESNQASFSFLLTVIEPLALAASLVDILIYSTHEVVSTTLPEGRGGLTPYVYDLQGSLPKGFSFDSVSRVIGGSASSAFNSTLIYSVADSENFTLVQNITIQVSELLQEFLWQAEDISLRVGESVNVILPPLASESNKAISYSVVGFTQWVLSFQ